MSVPTAATAYRSLLGTLRSHPTLRRFSATRSTRYGATSRYFSHSSIASVNYVRPTTRTATTSASPIPKSTASTTPTPAKPVYASKPSAPTKPTPEPTSSTTANDITATSNQRSLSIGLDDTLPTADPTDAAGNHVDWSRSFHGLSTAPFSDKASDALMAPINPDDVEIKPDGIIYLPEIKYRRILNKAFGPGGWGLAPRGETIVTGKSVTREYGLVVHGRLVSIARGEQQYFDPEGIPTATEGCKSNALMRCCKDLGIASELWDPVFIRKFKISHSKEAWFEHATTKKKRKFVMRKDVNTVPAGYKAT